MKKVRKAIIPAAGYGTRFLPATKAQPKEMLPIVDKPIIQYVVEDAVSGGIEDIIIVTGWFKRTIEDHFDYPFELEKRLEESGKHQELEEIRKIADMADFYYLRQRGPLGNGTPVLNAKDLIGDEPFLLLSGDDLFESEPSRSKQLIAAFEKYGAPVILTVKRDRPEDYDAYGFVEGEIMDGGITKVSKILEKPGKGGTTSDKAIVFGGVFTPDVFDALEKSKAKHAAGGGKGEFIFWDAVNAMMAEGKDVYALSIEGKYYDCGNKLEYLKTVVEFALKHEDLKEEFGKYLKTLK